MAITSFLKQKKFTIPLGIIIAVGIASFSMARSRNDAGNIITENITRKDVIQTVLATGQITSVTDLNLSFKISGVVARLNAIVGTKVKAGQILANLDQKDALATLSSAKASLAQAQANYQKTLEGATSEEIEVTQRSVDSAKVTLENARTSLNNVKNQQKTLVLNALTTLLNTG